MTQPIPRDAIYRRRVFDAEVIELCVRWYISYRLSCRDLVEIMAERGIQVAHTTILRWVLRYVPEYEKRWVDSHDRSARRGEGSLLRREHPCWRNVTVRTNRYLNNLIEQEHRAIKRRCASMAGFKSFANAAITIPGIELAHRIRKGQFSFGRGRGRHGWSRKAQWAMALA
jgi:transposase-like protein